MAERSEGSGGFTVLDGLALVTGAAVALVHLRSAVSEFDDTFDWIWGCGLFTWMSVTSAGPFVYLIRRFFSRPTGYPRIGDRLWALAGCPWLVAAIVKTGDATTNDSNRPVDPAYVGCLVLGISLVVLVSIPVVVSRVLLSDPSKARMSEPTPWTDRLGMILTVAWPLQFGVALILMS